MALDCVRDSGRRIYLPVVSEFDQGGGSGVDEPGTSNPNRVAVFFYLRRKCRFRRPAFGVFFGVTTEKIDGGSRCSFAVTSEENRPG